MPRKLYLLFIIFLLPIFTYAKSQKNYPEVWFTGALIADSADTLPPGLVNIQPYIYIADTYGRYNTSWGHQSTSVEFSVQSDTSFQFGLTKWMDITFDVSGTYNRKKDKDALVFNDAAVKISFQLMRDIPLTWKPYIRLIIREYFPTGPYQKLSPNKYWIDSGGTGSYETDIGIRASKEVFWIEKHPMEFTINVDYKIPSKVHVRGFNSYGGGFNTDGTVDPGNNFSFIFDLQFSFTKRWAFTMDVVQSYNEKVTFSGIPGTTATGKTATNTSDSSEQTSLAPGLEYSFNENVGILGGAWFTIRGRNSTEFLQAILSVTATF